MERLKTGQALTILLVVFVVAVGMFFLAMSGPAEAESQDARAVISVEHSQVDTGAEVNFNEVCFSTLTLTDPTDGILDGGLSGFILEVAAVHSGTPTVDSLITFPSEYALSDVKAVVTVRVSGVDLNDNFPKGVALAPLFTISPCITQAVVIQLDDDDGHPIKNKGDILFP